MRNWIAVDEKEITISGTKTFIWAIDLDNEEFIAVWISFGRSSLEAAAFLKKVREACDERLPRLFIDGSTWYPLTLKRTRLNRYIVVAFGYRSAIERLFDDIECRIRWFWNGLIGNYNRKSLQLWIEAFAEFRNCMKDSKGS